MYQKLKDNFFLYGSEHQCLRVHDQKTFPLPCETYRELNEIWIGLLPDLAFEIVKHGGPIAKAIYTITYKGIQINSYWIKPKWESMTPDKFNLARHRFYSGPIRGDADVYYRNPQTTMARSAYSKPYLDSFNQVWKMTEAEFQGVALMDALGIVPR